MKRKSIKFAAMTIKEANHELLHRLKPLYDKREAANITDWVMEHLTGWRKIDRIIHNEAQLQKDQEEALEAYTIALLDAQPVQYVLHETWFYGLKLFVNENTLIPRPETEELVKWVISDLNEKTASRLPRVRVTVIDIGCGSGCIALAVKKNVEESIVYGCDISAGALDVAQQNAITHKTSVSFIRTDITDRNQWAQLPSINIIVSNPPYIPISEINSMNANVLNYEPHLALFVENDDPLLFYRTIAEFAKIKLFPGGNIYVETHERLAGAVAQLFISAGFGETVIKKDMQGKQRMVRAAYGAEDY